MKEWRPSGATTLLVIVLAVTASTLWVARSVSESVDQVMRQMRQPRQSASTSTRNQAGTNILVVTHRRENESTQDWLTRHSSAVLVAQNSGK